MKKVILIDHEVWTLQRKRLMFDVFASAGIPVTVWDLSQWLYAGTKYPDELEYENYLQKIYSRKDFQRLLDTEDPENTIIVNEVYRVWHNRHVFRDITKRGFKTVFIDFYANSRIRESCRLTKSGIIAAKIWNAYLKLATTKHPTIPERIGLKMYFRLYGIKAYDHAFSSCRFCGNTNSFNHPDYESFKFHEKKRIVDGNYIVFCDTYFPLHPDLKTLLEEEEVPDARTYQNTMKGLFDKLEEKYGIPIVIAAHPKSNYRGDEFGDRKIIKYNTDNLVYYAEKVVIEICNSISYSILGNKPIAFVATNDYLKVSLQANIIKQWERGLGLKSQNLDKTCPMDVVFTTIAPEIRDQYIYSYLTTKETENTPNSETLKRFFSNL